MKIATDDFQKEVDYCASATIAKALLRAGLITLKEYSRIDHSFQKEYVPDLRFAGVVPDNFLPEKA
jgi:hypothetical protein